MNLLQETLLNTYGAYMHLKIATDNAELAAKYQEAIDARNAKMTRNIDHVDAGFDLFVPNYKINPEKIDHEITCSAQIVKPTRTFFTGYYLYPRSSIVKTQLRLANSVGIIDSGYRGHIIGVFDNLSDNRSDTFTVEKHDRLLQICAPNLMPIYAELVNVLDETERGQGGFGSTGK